LTHEMSHAHALKKKGGGSGCNDKKRQKRSNTHVTTTLDVQLDSPLETIDGMTEIVEILIIPS
jgi:hypothetical protein